jgi:hypothetical protein
MMPAPQRYILQFSTYVSTQYLTTKQNVEPNRRLPLNINIKYRRPTTLRGNDDPSHEASVSRDDKILMSVRLSSLVYIALHSSDCDEASGT